MHLPNFRTPIMILTGVFVLALCGSPHASGKTKTRLKRKPVAAAKRVTPVAATATPKPKPTAGPRSKSTAKPTATTIALATAKDVEHEASVVAGAYIRSLTTLDESRPNGYPITITITHAIPEDPNSKIETMSFGSFAITEEWLKSRTVDGFPKRSLGRLDNCQNGVCTFSFADGIQHSTVYLQSLRYQIVTESIVFTQMNLLDGD